MSTKKTPPSPRYLTILCEFMAFFHEKPKPYPKEHEFSDDELAAIKPTDIVKWMSVKAFGTPSPGPDAKITGSGSSSLEFLKKAVSFYMPAKEKWDEEKGRGNPTQSREVKELLQRVATLGGGRRKKPAEAAFPNIEDDGPNGLLQRVQAQNTEFINILDTMGSALTTFSRSVEQMRSALETNNIAIRHELAKEEAESGGEVKGITFGVVDDEDKDNDEEEEDADAADAAMMPEQEPVDIPAMEIQMKESIAHLGETVTAFMNKNAAGPLRDVRIFSGVDGFCTFASNTVPGKQMDVPDGFQLPSCDLISAWRHWIQGFPDFKVKNEDGTIIDAPIRPLRYVNTSDLPQSLKKKFKDGWRPILMSMQGDVVHMLETTPIASMDERFVTNSYNTAMSALVQKAPGMFEDSAADKCSTWKVATWSRKVREHQLGQQQVRRRQESVEVGLMPEPEREPAPEQHPPPQQLGQQLPTSPVVAPKEDDMAQVPMQL